MTPYKKPLINQLIENGNFQLRTDDNSWDYINNLYSKCKKSIGDIAEIVSRATGFLDENLAYDGEADVLVKGLLKSLEVHATHCKQLSTKHQGKQGYGVGPEEHSVILEIGLEYIQSHENFMFQTQYAAPRLQEIIYLEEVKLRDKLQAEENEKQLTQPE